MPDLLRVTIAVDSGGGLSVEDMLSPITDAEGAKEIIEHLATAQVHHSPGCCAPCQENNNPALVPFPGCLGPKKIAAANRAEAAKAKKAKRQAKMKVATGCRCTVVLVPN